VAVYSTLGLLNFRLGALPEADAAARIALQVVQEGDFAAGLAFAATALADVAVAGGQLDEAQALLDLLPQGSLPPGVGTVLIPAGRGRLRLAQGRPDEALAEFQTCIALWRPEQTCGRPTERSTTEADMTKMTDTFEIPSTRNVASGMNAAFSGGTIMSLRRVQISFAAVLMLSSAIVRSHLKLAAGILPF
jgi:hypothetical protein